MQLDQGLEYFYTEVPEEIQQGLYNNYYNEAAKANIEKFFKEKATQQNKITSVAAKTKTKSLVHLKLPVYLNQNTKQLNQYHQYHHHNHLVHWKLSIQIV